MLFLYCHCTCRFYLGNFPISFIFCRLGRLPNTWESADFWSGIVIWRSYVLQRILRILELAKQNQEKICTLNNDDQISVRTKLHPYDQLEIISTIESAWNMNKFAHEARKQRLVDVCVVALSDAGKLLKRVTAQNPDNINAEFVPLSFCY